MTSTRTYQRTFIGGEVSPDLWGRVDDPKYLNGCEKVSNWLVMPQGAVTRRPGTRFVREVADSTRATRLIPFTFGTGQSYAVEVCGATGAADSNATFGWIRLHIGGETVTRPAANSALAPARKSSATITFTNSGGDMLVNWASHPFTTTGVDRVCFQGSTGYSASFPVQPGVYYLFTAVDANTFKLSYSGSPTTRVPHAAPPAVTFTGHAYYGPGDFVTSGGLVYYCRSAVLFGQAVSSLTSWSAQPADGLLRIPHTYLDTQLRDIRFAQSNDVLTITSPYARPMELRRVGAQSWSLTPLLFSSQIVSPPPTLSQTLTFANYGKIWRLEDGFDPAWYPANNANGEFGVRYSTQVITDGAGNGTDAENVNHRLEQEDLVRVVTPVAPSTATLNGLPVVLQPGVYSVRFALANELVLRTLGGLNVRGRSDDLAFNAINAPQQNNSCSRTTHGLLWTDSAEPATAKYVVTSVAATGAESKASEAISTDVPLENSGAFVLLNWTPQYGNQLIESLGALPSQGASYYRVYKEQNGIYGYIGKAAQTAAPSFRDDNIGPDMSATPPIPDESLIGSDWPRCCTYYEQRRVFASTPGKPQDVWMTNAGTEADLTYHLPAIDSDRIYFRIAARTGGAIQHMVPLGHLVLLGSDTEWRVTPLNDDKVTPASISVRPQSYVGANNATPQLLNNVCLYAAARGGHIRELGWRAESSGYVTGDVSLRAAHLFDGKEVLELALSKAPVPILWAVSSTGNLLGCTYIGEEQVAAWHQHDLGGAVESVSVAVEGLEDILYVVVRRTIGGVAKRYIERMATVEWASVAESWFVDSGLQYYLAGTYSRSGTTLTVTTSTPHGLSTGNSRSLRFSLSSLNGTYTVTVTSTTQFTITTASGTGTGTVEVLASTISGLAHLEGSQVTILADGAVQYPVLVAGGSVTLPAAFARITVGLPFTSDLKTLPLALQADAMGQGRTKNVGRVWAKLVDSGAMMVGPDEGRLVPINMGASATTAEVQATALPGWTQSGQLILRVTDPTPATVTGLTLEVAIGS